MKPKTVTVVDYGLGNLFSVERAIRHVGANAIITDNPNIISAADYLILPGVGAFGQGISNLQEKGFIEPIKGFALSGRPFLGICLGMQLLMAFSEELGIHKGLNLIEGKVVRFPVNTHCKVPQIGWNEMESPGSDVTWKDTILNGIRSENSVYFIHSYVVVPDSSHHILATTSYGGYNYCSVIKKDSIYGCQFHPEKSGEVGLKILRNFLELGPNHDE